MLLLALTAFLVVFIILLLFLSYRERMSLEARTVVVTGGSSGIGRAVAADAYKLGANVLLVARDLPRLLAARRWILELHPGREERQRLDVLSLDLAGEPAQVVRAFREHLERHGYANHERGSVDVLLNCVGYSQPETFDAMQPADFERMMRVNFLSAVSATKAVLPFLMPVAGTRLAHKRIAFVSSMAGQLGIFGLSGYSATKFALRGLAESLQMELRPRGICVTLAFPPDTDTPGFAQENESKPHETSLICAAGGLLQPEQVASSLLQDVCAGRFFSYLGLDGWLLTTLTCGFAPADSLVEFLGQVLLMGPCRLIAYFYSAWMNRVVLHCATRERSRR